jgi:hypothetical protein
MIDADQIKLEKRCQPLVWIQAAIILSASLLKGAVTLEQSGQR